MRAPIPGETAAEHFSRCGPMCKHVELCRDCANVFGLCAAHAGSPSETFSWPGSAKEAPKPVTTPEQRIEELEIAADAVSRTAEAARTIARQRDTWRASALAWAEEALERSLMMADRSELDAMRAQLADARRDAESHSLTATVALGHTQDARAEVERLGKEISHLNSRLHQAKRRSANREMVEHAQTAAVRIELECRALRALLARVFAECNSPERIGRLSFGTYGAVKEALSPSRGKSERNP